MRNWIVLGIMGLLCCLNPAFSEESAAPFLMRHGYHVYDAPWHLNAGITFTQWVEEDSKGQIKVDTSNNYDLRFNEDLFSYLTEGKLDSAVITLENLAEHNPRFNMLFLPYLFENSRIAHKVMDEYLLDWINGKLKEYNLVALGILDFGFRQICSNDPNLKGLEDLQRVTLATQDRKSFVNAMAKIGVRLRMVPFEDLYKMLALGVVDGAEHMLSVMVAKQLFRVQKHLYLSNHFYEFMPMVFSINFLNKLPADLQQTLKATVKRAQQLNRDMCEQNEKEYLEYLRDNGMQVHQLPYDSFRDKIDAAYENIGQTVGSGDDLWQLFFEISRARYAFEDKRTE
ncbi:MAG: TRAP transporter substrate-binding protein [Succinivibrio sp.]|nr:TRAP transporter substrate-binding protein [Succinivibrio sp.]